MIAKFSDGDMGFQLLELRSYKFELILMIGVMETSVVLPGLLLNFEFA